MELNLRTLVYQGRVEIENVPVYYCAKCETSEIVEKIKPHMIELIKDLGNRPEKKRVQFNDHSEWSQLLVMAATQERASGLEVKNVREERMNELLDLHILAESLGLEEWMKEIEEKLKEVIEIC
jgi:hypothetical protein